MDGLTRRDALTLLAAACLLGRVELATDRLRSRRFAVRIAPASAADVALVAERLQHARD